MKKALPLFLATVVAGAVVAWSMYNKPHKDYAQEEVAQTWRAEDLVAAFAEAPDDMQAQWQEKVVEVTGTVRSSSMQGVVLNPGVVATYDEGHTRLNSRDVATARNLPQPIVAKLLVALSQAGLVDGAPGPKGGYWLAHPPAEISLYDIVSNFEKVGDRIAWPFGTDKCNHKTPCPPACAWA